MRQEQRQRSGDIVVSRVGAGTYVIRTIAGQQIGICHDRFEAMRRACWAARESGANVWMRADGPAET
jgi:hypothetical protein